MKKIIIIAEAGVNHNGSITNAKKLIDAAARAGADIIKFQTFTASSLLTLKTPKAKYQLKHTKKNESQFQMLKKLELSKEDHKILITYSKKKNIEFLSSAFDISSARLLKSMKINKIKIASGEIINLPFLKYVGKQNKFTILSTGMANMYEIKNAIKILTKNGLERKKLHVLHCTTSYPTKYQDVNLNAIKYLKDKLKINVGYSDHTLGDQVAIAAAAIGSTVIEKHITLNRKMKGPDHTTSLEPNEFKDMVKSIRIIEESMGIKKKLLTNAEKENKKIIRKSIFALKKISKGEILTEKNICIKRPGTGASPLLWEKFINSKATKNYNADDPIK